MSHGSPCWLCRDRRAGDTTRALQPLPRDGEIPAVNYLASMFINQQFLCKQTHPEPLLPVTLATAQSRPRLGMCSGLPPGPQPCLQLFAGSLFLPQGGFRSLDFLSIGSWASPSLNPGPPYCGIIDPPSLYPGPLDCWILDLSIIKPTLFHSGPLCCWILDLPSLNPGLPNNLILDLSVLHPGPPNHGIMTLSSPGFWISPSPAAGAEEQQPGWHCMARSWRGHPQGWVLATGIWQCPKPQLGSQAGWAVTTGCIPEPLPCHPSPLPADPCPDDLPGEPSQRISRPAVSLSGQS